MVGTKILNNGTEAEALSLPSFVGLLVVMVVSIVALIQTVTLAKAPYRMLMADNNIVDVYLLTHHLGHLHELIVAPQRLVVWMVDIAETAVILGTQYR